MRIIDVPPDLATRILDAIQDFQSISHELKRINKRLDRVEGMEAQESIDLANLVAKVTAGTTLDESIKVLVQEISNVIEIDDPAISALKEKLSASAGLLADAVKMNT